MGDIRRALLFSVAAAILVALGGCKTVAHKKAEAEARKPAYPASPEDYAGTTASIERSTPAPEPLPRHPVKATAAKPARILTPKRPSPRARAGSFEAWAQAHGKSTKPIPSPPSAAPTDFTPRVVESTKYYDVIEYEPHRFKVVQTGQRAGVTKEGQFLKHWTRAMADRTLALNALPGLQERLKEVNKKVDEARVAYQQARQAEELRLAKAAAQQAAEEARRARAEAEAARAAAEAARAEADAARAVIVRNQQTLASHNNAINEAIRWGDYDKADRLRARGAQLETVPHSGQFDGYPTSNSGWELQNLIRGLNGFAPTPAPATKARVLPEQAQFLALEALQFKLTQAISQANAALRLSAVLRTAGIPTWFRDEIGEAAGYDMKALRDDLPPPEEEGK